MKFEKFVLSNNKGKVDQKDVPWHNTYNKNKEVIGKLLNVHSVIICNKGLLLECSEFKSFIFEGQELYEKLIEALEYYSENPEESLPVYMEVTRNKMPDYGVNSEYSGEQYWFKIENAYIWTNNGAKSKENKPNPFLPRTKPKKGTRSKK